MKVAVIGLGKMGMQIANRFVLAHHEVIANDVSSERVELAKKQFSALAAITKEDVVKNFGSDQKVIWLMIPADDVDSELDSWLKLLGPGAIIIDGGNSNFEDTKARYERAKKVGIELVDVGTSGGVLGLVHGFSMMVGGEETAFKTVEPLLQSLSAPEGGYFHFGPTGAGHFLKMVHNSMEYGVMESLAEGYRLLKEGPYSNIDLSAAGEIWQKGSIIASDLNEMTAEVLKENPELTGIDGYVAESGEARWALELAKQRNLSLPAIQAAFEVRLASQKGEVNFATKLLAAMRNKFGGHDLNKR